MIPSGRPRRGARALGGRALSGYGVLVPAPTTGLVQLGILDPPVVEHSRASRILDAHDGEPGLWHIPLGPTHVHVGSRQLLLDIDVAHRKNAAQRDVG